MKYTMHIIFAIFMSASICCNDRQVFKTGMEGKIMPSFNLLLMDSITKLNTNTITGGKPIVLFYFEPTCPFCRAQIAEIVADSKSFKNIHFFLLSTFPFTKLKTYYNHYQLQKYTNITVGQDYDSYFENYFKATAVPYLAIYDNNKRLKQVLIGKVSDNLIKDIAYGNE